MKKRGFGAGRWNGAGGKVEKDETILQGAQRELKEEFGVTAVNPEQIGILFFEFDPQYEERLLECHVFKANSYNGQPEETEEMKPAWFPVNNLPYDKMWPDDRHWFKYMLQNKRFVAHFIFSNFDTIVKQEIKELSPVD
jgi:8-oxo-dGTP diphosphatase/2-hydroxy-dATP diphosphatase